MSIIDSKGRYIKGIKKPKEFEEYRLKRLREETGGENNYNWKGDRVGNTAVHTWVKKWKGVPTKCEVCGTTKAKKFEWANIDHRYRRVLDDYTRMCTKCHRNYDYGNHLCNIGSRGGSVKNKI